MSNCKNCGAPIDISTKKCAYCDTSYEKTDNVVSVLYADDKPIEFILEHDNLQYLFGM